MKRRLAKRNALLFMVSALKFVILINSMYVILPFVIYLRKLIFVQANELHIPMYPTIEKVRELTQSYDNNTDTNRTFTKMHSQKHRQTFDNATNTYWRSFGVPTTNQPDLSTGLLAQPSESHSSRAIKRTTCTFENANYSSYRIRWPTSIKHHKHYMSTPSIISSFTIKIYIVN